MSRSQVLVVALENIRAHLAQYVVRIANLENLAKPMNLVIDGDSLSIFSTTPGNDYPSQLVRALGGTITLQNFAVGGSTLSDPLSIPAREAAVDAAFVDDPGVINVFVGLMGGNDLKQFETPPAALLALHSAYFLRRKARGYYTVPVTLLPRHSSATPVSFEANRIMVNAGLRAAYPLLADVGSDPVIGAAGADLDPLLYPDGVHPSDLCASIMAQHAQAVVESL